MLHEILNLAFVVFLHKVELLQVFLSGLLQDLYIPLRILKLIVQFFNEFVFLIFLGFLNLLGWQRAAIHETLILSLELLALLLESYHVLELAAVSLLITPLPLFYLSQFVLRKLEFFHQVLDPLRVIALVANLLQCLALFALDLLQCFHFPY